LVVSTAAAVTVKEVNHKIRGDVAGNGIQDGPPQAEA
jgi:hypothetical protein